jgi:hypothetical protein
VRVVPVAGIVAGIAWTTGCSHGGAAAPSDSVASPRSSSIAAAALSPAERALATRLAHQQERRLTGDLVGASAFLSPGSALSQGTSCTSLDRVLYLRLVWESGEDFTHNHPPSDPPDGSRHQIFITADPSDGRICQVGADYRHPGAGPGESLLFGAWPDSAAP